MAKLWDLIALSATQGASLQRKDGSMPAGHNGPWLDKDTPVRNTAHWAITFSKAHQVTGKEIFKEKAFAACEYLLSEKALPYKQAFYCRDSKKKNRSNGLIGQVWAIEPFLILGRYYDRKDYLEFARDKLLEQPFDEDLKLWKIREISGEVIGITRTFNQQLWFAQLSLAVANSTKSVELFDRSNSFFENLEKRMVFLDRGLLSHEFPLEQVEQSRENPISPFRRLLRKAKKFFSNLANVNDPYEKSKPGLNTLSNGYLSFNLYGFALAYSESKEKKWWKNLYLQSYLKDIFEYVEGISFLRLSQKNDYAWAYNPVGFEIAFALDAFQELLPVNGSHEKLSQWVEIQLKSHWDASSSLLKRNTQDPDTLAARIYEATRIPNMDLKID